MANEESSNICGACRVAITICPECGGKLCTPDCPDRAEDGCVCEQPADEA